MSRRPAPALPAPAHPSAHRRTVTELLLRPTGPEAARPAALLPDAAASYAELRAATLLAARRLRAAGVEPGDRIGILLRKGSLDYVTLGLAVLCLGATCVPVNARNKVRELRYVLEHSGMRLLLTDGEFRDLVTRTGLPAGCAAVVLGDDPAFEAGADAVSEGEVLAIEATIRRDDPALMLYTSGTTSDPKGCLHSHATLLAEGENCCERLGVTADDRFWTPLPLFHVGGWQVLVTTLSRGACFVHPGAFEATVALDQLEQHRVTIAFPAFELMWNEVLAHPRLPQADLRSLRVVINVGAPARLAQMQAQVPQAVQVSCFGSTESCGSICLGDPARDPLESRLSSSGRPLTGVEVRIVDPATGAVCASGTPGELHFRGPTRFVGYFRDPETTAAAIDEEGWFRTGDLMVEHPDGTLTYLSRLKDMLKVGGENVAAADIEGYLTSHPDIAVAAVVGVRDARYGEVPAAYVQLAEGATLSEAEVIAFCVGHIATYKVPRYLRVVEDFPVTATRKIQKFVLREQIAAELDDMGVEEAPRIPAPGRPTGRDQTTV
ncbi:MAG: acyl--CoA ligase [Solirubrobacterales bacterium]|jgi:fatty-acyl-CoA synthase|nr:acyl--CoA ligase [Solirubrobacterales bacterium]